MGTSRKLSSLVAALCLVAVVAVPLAASAMSATSSSQSYDSYSIEQLEQLIAKLQKRLTELKTQSKCFIADVELSLGDGEEGDSVTAAVRRLQDFLREKGYFKYKSTGYFGKVTRTSLMAFQKANGVSQTGVFDAATREKAHSMYCKVVVKKATNEKKKVVEDEKPAEKAEGSSVKSLTLTATGGSGVAWTVDGKSAQGYKVVWSKNANPTYPTRDGDQYLYFSDPATLNATLNAFSGAGAYFVRVCEYLGGQCGVYSNQVTVQLAE